MMHLKDGFMIDWLTNGIWVETEDEKEYREYQEMVDADCFI